METQKVEAVSNRRSERGTILIQVAIGSVVLIAFSMFVIDYGMMWVARRQAQNAADAGALAGAVAMALDADNRASDGPAKTAAYRFAVTNAVLGQNPSVTDPTVAATDVKFYSDDPTKFPATCSDNSCIRVDVYRNQERDNAIPAWFGGLVGVTNSGVKATATAQAAIGNATDCLKPWAVVDKWAEHYPIDPGTWTVDSTYDKYDKFGNPDPKISAPKQPDYYEAPTDISTGTGFHPYNADGSLSPDYGLDLTMKLGATKDYDYPSGWFLDLALADSTGKKDLGNNIKHCVGTVYSVGQDLTVDSEPGKAAGPIRQAVGDPSLKDNQQDADSLYKQDPTAYWDTRMNGGRGGVNGSKYAVSPRIVAVPLVSPEDVYQVMKNGKSTVRIINIMGFFVDGLDNKGNIHGHLMTMPGLMATGSPTIGSASAFLHVIQLVR